MPVRERQDSEDFPVKKIATYALGSAAVIFAGTILFGSWYTVNQTERAVVLTNGAISSVVGPGLHFKLPIVQSANHIDVMTHNVSYDNMEAYSEDQQPAHMKVSITYHVSPDKMEDMYSRFTGDREKAIDRLVRPIVFAHVKNVFGQFSAAKAIKDRAKLNADATAAITKAIEYDPVIVIESAQIENIEFSRDYIKNIEARMAAEVKVQEQQQRLEQEKIMANIAVTQAKGRADSVRAEAEAEAAKRRAIGEADAYAIDIQGKALAQNPKLIDLRAVDKWSGTLPTSMIPGSAVPFVNLQK